MLHRLRRRAVEQAAVLIEHLINVQISVVKQLHLYVEDQVIHRSIDPRAAQLVEQAAAAVPLQELDILCDAVQEDAGEVSGLTRIALYMVEVVPEVPALDPLAPLPYLLLFVELLVFGVLDPIYKHPTEGDGHVI